MKARNWPWSTPPTRICTRRVQGVSLSRADCKVYGEIDAQLKQWHAPASKLHLSATAPKLLSLRDIVLTVPGML